MTSHATPSLRDSAVKTAIARAPNIDLKVKEQTTSAYFGEHSLSWLELASQLDGASSQALRDMVAGKSKMSKSHGNRVGEAVMRWAQKHGVTHFCHWFHPLTGVPAEKHDAFLARGFQDSHRPIEEFPGSMLIQGETDGSSFPSGGLRATHEARGYTIWDPTSPMFIREEGGTRTLCIPAVFIGWGGQALDTKAPLLRALDSLDREARAFLRALTGSDEYLGVYATLGAEQEYFLVDRAFLAARPDLVMAGRALVGAAPTRGQQLEDHYFGPIPARVQAYMADVERELNRLGVPIRTRHNEVAPAQFETAPVFEQINVACDHNVLVMDTLRRVAERHGFACLLHEKPFAGVNGSGKHNNWSLATFEGTNLLEPTAEPHKNLPFLGTLAAVFRTMNEYSDVLRSAIASAGNDHRLGANEAPPAILSVYLGSALDAIVESIAAGKTPDLNTISEIAVTEKIKAKKDLTDRNRTTPFAFTGNKFEFRAVGSSENCAWPMTILNAGMAASFKVLRERLEAKIAKGTDRSVAAAELVREVFNETKRVRFEGNNYSAEWKEEAKKRGLPINSNTATALAPLAKKDRVAFLLEQGVFSAEEIQARHDILSERYIKQIEVEARTILEIVTTKVVPAVELQAIRSAQASEILKASGGSALSSATLSGLGKNLGLLNAACEKLNKQLDGLHHGEIGEIAMRAAHDVVPTIAEVRQHTDALENLVADELWPLPKFREMLFLGNT